MTIVPETNAASSKTSGSPVLGVSSDVGKLLDSAKANSGISNENFALLLQILLMREARVAAKEKSEEDKTHALNESRKRDAITYQQDMIRKQKSCRHLKGGKGRLKNQQKDYAVYHHTFIDGDSWIKCNLCSMKWRPKDTKEFLIRSKKTIFNWTNIGWAEALEMAENSSNRASSSEQPLSKQIDISAPRTETGEEIPDLQI